MLTHAYRSRRPAFPFLFTLILATGCSSAPKEVAPPPPDPAVVESPQGKFRGKIENEILSFKGIPYAQPPVGELRWRAPAPVAASGPRDAMDFGADCMQTSVAWTNAPIATHPSEDCLFLNVWRPVKSSSGPRPVLVWIHGGGLVNGGSSSETYDGSELARQDVVVVSLNYRLGRFGFFAHPALSRESHSEARANYGYLDQIAALKWIQKNIAAFGGDPKSVTLMGQSAGAGSILVHLSSSLSEGLFHRAILQSTAYPGPRERHFPLYTLEEAERKGVAFASSLGIRGSQPRTLEALRALPAEALAQGIHMTALSSAHQKNLRGGVPRAILDGEFLVRAPESDLRSGQFRAVPLIVGINSGELSVVTAKSKSKLFSQFKPDAKELKALYDPSGKTSLAELQQSIGTDRDWAEPTRFLAKAFSSRGAPVWTYRFSYVPERLRYSTSVVAHAAEVPFVMGTLPTQYGERSTASDKKTSQQLMQYWTTFAKKGDPNLKDLPHWEGFSPEGQLMMEFSSLGPSLKPDPARKRLDYWEKKSQTRMQEPVTPAE